MRDYDERLFARHTQNAVPTCTLKSDRSGVIYNQARYEHAKILKSSNDACLLATVRPRRDVCFWHKADISKGGDQFDLLVSERAGEVDFTTSNHRKNIIEQAAQSHLPVIYQYRFIAAEGGLISYGIDITDLYRRAAS